MDDVNDPDISFDDDGHCCYCRSYYNSEKRLVVHGEEGRTVLTSIFERIKRDGHGKENDCVLGLSGGVDSSYVAYIAWKAGLHVILAHLDNHWDTKTSQQNTQRIAERTGFPLVWDKPDWEEFKDMQLSMLRSGVIDIEALTDNALAAWLYKLASKSDVKWILSGSNVVTEKIMPPSWSWLKNDARNIRAIHKQYGKMPIKTVPLMGLLGLTKYMFIKGIKTVYPLNYVDYNKAGAKSTLMNEFGWLDYEGKHYENIWTKFYQAYVLPTKYGVDKRKAHLSTLICSGQITREEALKELEKPTYTAEMLDKEKLQVLKRLDLSPEEFDSIMKQPPRSHLDYPNEQKLFYILRRLNRTYWAIKSVLKSNRQIVT